MDANDIESFYDDFLESKMLGYRISGNLRIERATERILEFVHTDSRVLDVGCGIGITAERVADKTKEGYVWAFDISERNIWYARETIDKPNVTFFSSDISKNKERVKSFISKPIDVISLVDVIEHLPKEEHPGIFEFFRSITGDQSYIVLTYPSPQYQQYLKESNPDELQIVDQVVEREELVDTAKSAGFSLRHYSLEDVWERNQYVHCVLQTDPSLSSIGESSSNPDSVLRRLIKSLKSRIKHRWNQHVRYPYRKWKYVDRIFS